MTNLTKLSEQLLLAVKLGDETKALEDQLANQKLETLKTLNTDNLKKTFWINIYNAWFQILRKRENKTKPEIYRERLFTIAGHPFSLDDVEHGILRKFRYKYSLGYLANPFVKSLIKELAVEEIDYRIHFALNCGAKSCPPIAFYSSNNIDEQLELATLSFLESETEVKTEKKEIHITTLFKWFLGDFGGMKGVRQILERRLGLSTKGFKLVFAPYSWDEHLDNYNEMAFATEIKEN